MFQESNHLKSFSQPSMPPFAKSIQNPVSLPFLHTVYQVPDRNETFDQVYLSLNILRMDPADRAVIKVADERDAIQKKAFTNWVNQHLLKRNCWVQDLFTDFRTGYLLVRLLECLTNEVLGLEYVESRVHWIQNVQRVLDFLRYRGIRIVNIRAEDIVDGNPKLTLGLIWIIIVHFQLAELLKNHDKLQSSACLYTSMDQAAREALLNWSRSVTSTYSGVIVRDFTNSWRDGRAFLALIHRYKPELVDLQKVENQTSRQNLELAFDIAHTHLNVTRLFDAEDIYNNTDERAIITYIALLYNKLAASSTDPTNTYQSSNLSVISPLLTNSAFTKPANSTDHRYPDSIFPCLQTDEFLSENIKLLWFEYRRLAVELIQWLQTTTNCMTSRYFPPDLKSMKERMVDELRQHRRVDRPQHERMRQQLVRMYGDLKPSIERGELSVDLFLRIDQIHRLWEEYEIALQERELAVRNEIHRLDRLQWSANRMMRECATLQSQLTALDSHIKEINQELVGRHSLDTTNELKNWQNQLTQIESKLNGLFNQVQHLRTGRHVQTEQIYRTVCTLHQHFLNLKRYYEEQIYSCATTNPDTITDMLSNNLYNHKFNFLISSNNNSNLKTTKSISSIERCMNWTTEKLNTIQSSSYGTDVKSIDDCTRRHEFTHREVVNFRQEIDRCRTDCLKQIGNPEEETIISEAVQILEQNYQHLLEASSKRRRTSLTLCKFVKLADTKLAWLRERECREVMRDWSHVYRNAPVEAKHEFQKLMQEIHENEATYNEISVLGSTIQLENSTLVDVVQAYLGALERHWAWLLQLIFCFEAHLEHATRFQAFINDTKQCEDLLTAASDELCSYYESTLKPMSWEQGECLLKQSQELFTRVMGQEQFIFQLVDLSQELVPPISLVMTDTRIDSSVLISINNNNNTTSNALTGRRVRLLCTFHSSDYQNEWTKQSSTTAIPVDSDTLLISSNNNNSGISKTKYLYKDSLLNQLVKPIYWPDTDADGDDVGAGVNVDNTASFDKGDFLTILEIVGKHKVKLRTNNGYSLNVPVNCLLPCWPCLESTARAKHIISGLQYFRTCWLELDLRLRGQLLSVSMTRLIEDNVPQSDLPVQLDIRRIIYADAELHCVALQLANRPQRELDAFKLCFTSFQNNFLQQTQLQNKDSVIDFNADSLKGDHSREIYSITEELRSILDTLARRLRDANARPLPAKLADMEILIKDHKEWSNSLARVRAQCSELTQHLDELQSAEPNDSKQNGQLVDSSSNMSHVFLSASLSAIDRAAGELALVGHEFACRLADTDAWIARLEQIDQALTDCELNLLGSAVKVHGLLSKDDAMSDASNESADADGLRVQVMERAHTDLKFVAQRLPQIRSEIDLLSQQLTRFTTSTLTSMNSPSAESFSTNDSSSLSQYPNTDMQSKAKHIFKLNLCGPVDNRYLETGIAWSDRRFAEATKEVEYELKAFGETIVYYGNYQNISTQLFQWMDEFQQKSRLLSERVRSKITQPRDNDTNIISKNAHTLNEVADDLSDMLVNVQQNSKILHNMNFQVAQMIFTLTNYAQRTQTYRDLVEGTFQKFGGSRDYRWSPGYGLFDIPKILKTTDDLNDQFVSQSKQISELLKLVKQHIHPDVIKETSFPEGITFKSYIDLFPGHWPKELNNQINTPSISLNRQLQNSNNEAQLSLFSSSTPIKYNSFEISPDQVLKPQLYSLYLSYKQAELHCLLPRGWHANTFRSLKKSFQIYGSKLFPTTGSCFLVKLLEYKDKQYTNEFITIGDALRCGFINPIQQTCCTSQSTNYVNWSNAIEKGWLHEYTLKALSKSIRISDVILNPISAHLCQSAVDDIISVDSKSKQVLIDPLTGQVTKFNKSIAQLFLDGLMNAEDYHHLCSILSTGLYVRMCDTKLNWIEAVSQTDQPPIYEVPHKPCLSDWLAAGAYYAHSKKLRLCQLQSKQSINSQSTTKSQQKMFVVDELTIKDAVNRGLIDPTLPEFVVPYNGSMNDYSQSFRRICLNDAIQMNLINDSTGVWLGEGANCTNTEITVDVLQAAGLLCKAPSLTELILSGLVSCPSIKQFTKPSENAGILDIITGQYLLIPEAIQRGHVIGDQPAFIVNFSKFSKQTVTLLEALDMQLLTASGLIKLPNGTLLNLWDAVNQGHIELIYTQIFPPPVGIVSGLNRKQSYYQHPILQALRTGSIDPTKEEIVFSLTEARQHGLSINQRRIPLRKASKLFGVCDQQSVDLITQPCGLFDANGLSINGSTALNAGWLTINEQYHSTTESIMYGRLIDPISNENLIITEHTQWPKHLRLNSVGARLLLSLSMNRPNAGYLVIQRTINYLAWLGPGLADDTDENIDLNSVTLDQTRDICNHPNEKQLRNHLKKINKPVINNEVVDKDIPNVSASVNIPNFENQIPAVTLLEMIKCKQCIELSKSQCLITHPDMQTKKLSLKEAIQINLVDNQRSVVKQPQSQQYITLDKAIASGIVNDIHGLLLIKGGKWITLTEAANRGLLNEVQLPKTDLVDMDSVSSTILRESIDPNYLSPNRNREDASNVRTSTHSVDSLLIRAAKRRLFDLPSRHNTLPRTICTNSVLDNSGQNQKSNRTDMGISRLLSCHRGRVEQKELDDSHSLSDLDGASLAHKRVKLRDSRMNVKLKRRHCVLYAFYYLHDEVRVEVPITVSMLHDKRVDVQRRLVCDPVTGKIFPIPEALTNGFVFGIVFTHAEQQLESDTHLYWLELFHYRHDIYQLQRVFDPHLNRLVSVAEAIESEIIDPVHCTYTHPSQGSMYSIEESLHQGWIQALPSGSTPPFDFIGSHFDTLHVRTVDEGYSFIPITPPLPIVVQQNAMSETESDAVSQTTSLTLTRHLPKPIPPRIKSVQRGSPNRHLMIDEDTINESAEVDGSKIVRDSILSKTPKEMNNLDQNKVATVCQYPDKLTDALIWVCNTETNLLSFDDFTLDETFNRNLVNAYQDIFTKLLQRKPAIQSILTDVEQTLLRLKQDKQNESVWKPLEKQSTELKSHFDDLALEAETRLRSRMDFVDLLRNFNINSQNLKRALSNYGTALTKPFSSSTSSSSSSSSSPDKKKYDDSQIKCINDLHLLQLTLEKQLTVFTTGQNVINTLGNIKTKLIGHMHQYTNNDRNYRQKWNSSQIDKVLKSGTENMNQTEVTIQNRINKLNEQLVEGSNKLTNMLFIINNVQAVHKCYKEQLEQLKELLNQYRKNLSKFGNNKNDAELMLYQLYEWRGDLDQISVKLKNLETFELQNLNLQLNKLHTISCTQFLQEAKSVHSCTTSLLKYDIDLCDQLIEQLITNLISVQPKSVILNEALITVNKLEQNSKSDQLGNEFVDGKTLTMDKLTVDKQNKILEALKTNLLSNDSAIGSEDKNSQLQQIELLQTRLKNVSNVMDIKLQPVEQNELQFKQLESQLNELENWIESQIKQQTNQQKMKHLSDDYLSNSLQLLQTQLLDRNLQLKAIQKLSEKCLLNNLSDGDADKLRQRLAALESSWSNLNKLIGLSEENLKSKETTYESFTLIHDQIDDWLTSTEDYLNNLPSTCEFNLPLLENQLNELKTSTESWNGLQGNLNELTRLAALYESTVRKDGTGNTSSTGNALSQKSQKIHDRHEKVGSLLKHHHNRLQDMVKALQMFVNQCNNLNESLKADRVLVEKYRYTADGNPVTDVAMITESIDNNNRVKSNLDELDTKYVNITKLFNDILRNYANVTGVEKLHNSMQLIENEVKDLKQLTNQSIDQTMVLDQQLKEFHKLDQTIEQFFTNNYAQLDKIKDGVGVPNCTDELLQLKQNLTDLAPSIEEFNKISHVLNNHLNPVLSTQLGIKQKQEYSQIAFDKLNKDISIVESRSALPQQSVIQCNKIMTELLNQLNDIKTRTSSPKFDSNLKKNWSAIADELQLLQPQMDSVRRLCVQSCNETTVQSVQLNLNTNLLKLERLYNQLLGACELHLNGKEPIVSNQLQDLSKWLLTNSEQIQKYDDINNEKALVDELAHLKGVKSKLQLKQDELDRIRQNIDRTNDLNENKNSLIMLELCQQKYDSLNQAVQLKQEKLNRLMNEKSSELKHLVKIELWINNGFSQLMCPICPDGQYFNIQTKPTTQRIDYLNKLKSEIRTKHNELMNLPLTKISGPQVADIKNKLNQFEYNVKQQFHAIQLTQTKYHLCEENLSNFRDKCDKLELNWLNLQGQITANNTSVELTPPDMMELQTNLNNLLTKQLRLYETDLHTLKQALLVIGDGDVNNSIRYLSDIKDETKNRLEIIQQTLLINLPTLQQKTNITNLFYLCFDNKLKHIDDVFYGVQVILDSNRELCDFNNHTVNNRLQYLNSCLTHLNKSKHELDVLDKKLSVLISQTSEETNQTDEKPRIQIEHKEKLCDRIKKFDQLNKLTTEIIAKLHGRSEKIAQFNALQTKLVDFIEEKRTWKEVPKHRITDLQYKQFNDDQISLHQLYDELLSAGTVIIKPQTCVLNMTLYLLEDLTSDNTNEFQIKKVLERLSNVLVENQNNLITVNNIVLHKPIADLDLMQLCDSYRALLTNLKQVRTTEFKQLNELVQLIQPITIQKQYHSARNQMKLDYDQLEKEIQNYLQKYEVACGEKLDFFRDLSDAFIQLGSTEDSLNKIPYKQAIKTVTTVDESTILLDYELQKTNLRNLAEQLAGYRTRIEKLVSRGKSLCDSESVRDLNSLLTQLINLENYYDHLCAEIKKKSFISDTALPTAKILTDLLNSLNSRITLAEAKLASIEPQSLANGATDLTRSSVIDQLDYESVHTLAPQVQALQTNLIDLEHLREPDVFLTPVTFDEDRDNDSAAETSLNKRDCFERTVDQINNGMSRFQKFNDKVNSLTRSVGSDRKKIEDLTNTLRSALNWLNVAVSRFDPQATDSPTIDWDQYLEENDFATYESQFYRILHINSLGCEFPYLAVFPSQLEQLDKLGSRIEQFKINWTEYYNKLNDSFKQVDQLVEFNTMNSTLDTTKSIIENKHISNLSAVIRDKSYLELNELMANVTKQASYLDNQLHKTETRFSELHSLIKSFTCDVDEFQLWLNEYQTKCEKLADTTELDIEQLPDSTKHLEMIKESNIQVEKQRSILDRIIRTSDMMLPLLPSTEANSIRAQIKSMSDRYYDVRKLFRNKLALLDSELKHSDELTEQLHTISDLFANIYENASQIGVSIPLNSQMLIHSLKSPKLDQEDQNRLSSDDFISGSTVIGDGVGSVSLPGQQITLSMDFVDRIHSMMSVQPDHLQDRVNETSILLDLLEQRLPQLNVLITSIKKEQDNRISTSEASGDVVDYETVLQNALNLQKDWFELKDKLQTRVNILNSVYQMSAEKFWPIVEKLKTDLNQIKESLCPIAMGCCLSQSEIKLDPFSLQSYQLLKTDLGSLKQGLSEIATEIDKLHNVGHTMINLIQNRTEHQKPDLQLNQDETQAMRNEIQYALHELSSLQNNLSTNCESIQKELDEKEINAAKFEHDLYNLRDWAQSHEEVFEKFLPPAENPQLLSEQLKEIIQWTDGLMHKHVDLEMLNWCYGQLMSTNDQDILRLINETKLGELSSIPTQQSPLQSEITTLNRKWDNLLDSGNARRHHIQTALLGLGELDGALHTLTEWIIQMQMTIDEIAIRRGDMRGLEADLAKIKVISNTVNSHQLAVLRIQEQAKKLDQKQNSLLKTNKPELKTVSAQSKISHLNEIWEVLKSSVKNKQSSIEAALKETYNFNNLLDQLIRRTRQLEGRLPVIGARSMGGLPDSAREQLRRFMGHYDGIIQIGTELQELSYNSATLLISRPTQSSSSSMTNQLITNLNNFTKHHTELMEKIEHIKTYMQSHLNQIEDFHNHVAQLMQWLTQIERTIIQQKPISRIVSRLYQQIRDHTELRKEITRHREALISLNKLGSEIQCLAQKQDVILVKNLLSSIHTRWEQLVSRSTERTRQLNVALKESNSFLKKWSLLTDWLKDQLINLDDSEQIATRPEKIAHQLVSHHEFQRTLTSHTATFDGIRRFARQLRDRAPASDHTELDDMVGELKHLWQTVCTKALNRQRALEKGLLSAGFYKEAVEALLDWLGKMESHLTDKHIVVYGDVDIVEQLIEMHQSFLVELGHKAETVKLIHQAADELVSKATSSQTNSNVEQTLSLTKQAEISAIQSQLNHLTTVWNRVQNLAQRHQEKLEHSLVMAKQFRDICRSLMDYFAGAECVIYRLTALPTCDEEQGSSDGDSVLNHNGISTSSHDKRASPMIESDLTRKIEAFTQTRTNLLNQSNRVDAALELGHKLLDQAHPDSVKRLRQWINTIHTRWEALTSWSEQRGERLRTALADQERRQLLRGSLLKWVTDQVSRLSDPLMVDINTIKLSDSTESLDTLSRSDDSKPNTNVCMISLNEIMERDIIELLMQKQTEMEEEIKHKKSEYEEIIRHAKRRPSTHRLSIRRMSRVSVHSGQGRTLSGHRQSFSAQPVQVCKVYTSSQVNQLCTKWRELCKAIATRRTHLRERLLYLKEIENMKDFHFESWRQRYVGWLSTTKARVIDLFHRKDRDRDGKLTKAEFIDGILEMKFQTNRVEMKTVADIFDSNGDGYIDYRECLHALRANYPVPISNLQRNTATDGSSLSLNRIDSTDEETINDEVRRQVGLCTCHNTYKIRKMSNNKYRFGDSQKLCLVRILRSAVMVRVGGGWITLDEFLAKNDPCRDACQRLTSLVELAKAVGIGCSSQKRGHITTHQTTIHSRSNSAQNPYKSNSTLSSNSSQTHNSNRAVNIYHSIHGPNNQENAFYLVIPNTKPNPANHQNKRDQSRPLWRSQRVYK